MTSFATSAVVSGIFLISAAVADPAPNQFDPKVTAMRAAIACSDRQLEILAKGTGEPIEAVAFAAMDNCHVLWQRAAATSADDRQGEKLYDFSAGFLAAAHARYPDHARPLILRWRAQS